MAGTELQAGSGEQLPDDELLTSREHRIRRFQRDLAEDPLVDIADAHRLVVEACEQMAADHECGDRRVDSIFGPAVFTTGEMLDRFRALLASSNVEEDFLGDGVLVRIALVTKSLQGVGVSVLGALPNGAPLVRVGGRESGKYAVNHLQGGIMDGFTQACYLLFSTSSEEDPRPGDHLPQETFDPVVRQGLP